MLYRLTIQNFGAIRERQILDLTMSAKVEAEPNRQLSGGYQIRVPRVNVILGANASGKTTALRALAFMAEFTSSSAQYPPEIPLFLHPFWDDEAYKVPTVLSVEFVTDWISPGAPTPFRYTLICQTGKRPYDRVVEKELLECRVSSQWATLVDRQGATASFRRQMARLSGAVPQSALARQNVSVFSLLSQFVANNSIVNSIKGSLSKVESNLSFWFRSRRTLNQIAGMYATDASTLSALNRLITRADLGIKGVRVEELKTPAQPESKQWSMYFEHSGLTRQLHSSFESHGTMNFVSLFPSVYKALADGGIALMDELDSDLHPELLKEVTGWFNDPEINTSGAQLFMTCNNPAILDTLRKEEIYFASKDGIGRTSLYALKDIQGVRRGANFQRDYLAGRYGAVPHIG